MIRRPDMTFVVDWALKIKYVFIITTQKYSLQN